MSNNTGTNKPFQRKGPPTESDSAWSSAKYPGKWDSSKKYPAGKPFEIGRASCRERV